MSTSLATATATATADAAASMPHAVDWNEMFAQRSHLVRFAQRRLHDAALAEDLVHDVFEAVLSGHARFAGRSGLRTWLVGVLKHKIVDLIRQRSRYDALDDDDDSSHAAQLRCPQPQPDEVAEQRQRLAAVLARMQQLSPGLRDAVELRLIHEHSTEEVCRALNISQDNLFVRLHRARRALVH